MGTQGCGLSGGRWPTCSAARATAGVEDGAAASTSVSSLPNLELHEVWITFLVGQSTINLAAVLTHVTGHAAEDQVDLLHLTPAAGTCAPTAVTCDFHTTAAHATVAAVEGFRGQPRASGAWARYNACIWRP